MTRDVRLLPGRGGGCAQEKRGCTRGKRWGVCTYGWNAARATLRLFSSNVRSNRPKRRRNIVRRKEEHWGKSVYFKEKEENRRRMKKMFGVGIHVLNETGDICFSFTWLCCLSFEDAKFCLRLKFFFFFDCIIYLLIFIFIYFYLCFYLFIYVFFPWFLFILSFPLFYFGFRYLSLTHIGC